MGLVGRDRDAVAIRQRRLGPGLEREVLGQVEVLLLSFERGLETLVVHDGVRNLLKHPEFADASRLQQVLEVLEETGQLSRLREALGKTGWHELSADDGTIALDLEKVVYVLVDTEGHRGGVGT